MHQQIKRSFNEQVLSDQPQRFSGCDVVTCVAQELTLGQATKTSLHVTDLISLGFSLDNVDWQSFLVWPALQSVTFGDTFAFHGINESSLISFWLKYF